VRTTMVDVFPDSAVGGVVNEALAIDSRRL
jgi:hypothetical protein